MKRMCALIALLLAPAAFAEEAYTLESLSAIRDFETADLDRQSIQRLGELTRFDVRVRWRDPEQRPPNAPASRFIRYVAKCGEKSMGVAAVATVDGNGKMLKSYVVPPGGSDFASPVEGSREAGLLQAACRD